MKGTLGLKKGSVPFKNDLKTTLPHMVKPNVLGSIVQYTLYWSHNVLNREVVRYALYRCHNVLNSEVELYSTPCTGPIMSSMESFNCMVHLVQVPRCPQ